jgi:hypothetical protein
VVVRTNPYTRSLSRWLAQHEWELVLDHRLGVVALERGWQQWVQPGQKWIVSIPYRVLT